MIHLTEFKTTHIDDVVQLSRSLEDDSFPCSYWGLDSGSAAQLLEHPQKRTFVTLQERTLSGIATLTRGGAFQTHLAEISIAVHPSHRRDGLAGTLIGQLEKTAGELQIELLKAMISTNNVPSRRLFESLGFEHRATLYCEFKSPEFGEIDECVYYKRLPALSGDKPFPALSGAQPPIEP